MTRALKEAGIAKAETFGEQMNAVAQALKDGLGAFDDITTLQRRFPKFQENMVYVVTAMAGLTKALKEAGIAEAKTFGEQMNAVAQALKDGLGAFDDIKNRAQGGDPHNAMDALWGFVRNVGNALQEAINTVIAKLAGLVAAMTNAIPAISLASYNYGYAIGRGIRSGFYDGLGTLTFSAAPVYVPAAVGAGAPGAGSTTVNLGGIHFAGGISSGLDVQRLGDYVVQRVRNELGR